MTGRPATPAAPLREPGRRDRLTIAAAFGALAFIALIGIRAVGEIGSSGTPSDAGGGVAASTAPSEASPTASIDPAAFLDPFPRPAPALALTGPGGVPVALTDYLGDPVLVFFGYTHCPDVCPVTIGAVGEAIDAYGGEANAIFVSVDPERDTIPWLAEFVKYMPAGFTAVTGSLEEVRTTADAWGVRYAKVDTDDPDAYQMAHTADVFVVDGAGQFRGRLPFGTEAATMAGVLEAVAAAPVVPPSPTVAPVATPAPSPGPTTVPSTAPTSNEAPVGALVPEVVSSSVWAGGSSPVILALRDGAERIDDPDLPVTVQVTDAAGAPVGPPVPATAVQPRGITDVSFVATVDIPTPGTWSLEVRANAADGAVLTGTTSMPVLDPGGSAALGAPAPTIRTPTAADFGGDLTWVTTDPDPNPDLSSTSTADALAAGEPFVLVVDSYSFKVTPACGKAVVMANQLVYRWTDVPFIHHEPYRYTVVTTEPVIEGSLADPILTDAAEAWGVGSAPWGVGSMPWLFVVDGDGTVRAKYQGVMGSADVDVILTMLAAEGAGGA